MSHTVSFKDITTLRVGGSIQIIEHADSKEQLVQFVQEQIAKSTPFLVVGGGSNILAADNPYDGSVIIPTFAQIIFEDVGVQVRVIADAGVEWDTLVQKTVEEGLWGLENLSGIPGTVGASPMQNIGAYGADVSDTVEWVEVYDTKTEKTFQLKNNDLAFGYRTSLLKQERGRYVVLRVSYLVSKKVNPNLSYKDLAHAFEGISNPSLSDIRDAVIRIRATKFPNLNEHGTAGSFFLNPILSENEAASFLALFPDAPHFPHKDVTKFSLAWILDAVVHAKGMHVGNAFVWEKQPLVIATKDPATGDEVRTLMKQLQKKVFEKTKIKIYPEVFVM